jgi:alpha-D-ribose 1-methylphosphonate 5-phosphate C-P lyase
MHAYEEYGLQYVSLYESVSAYRRIAATASYPVIVDERYLMSPSPIPKFDNPKLHMSPALMLFGAGREKRIYAVPPYTRVRSLDFEDYPFETQRWDDVCALCGAEESYLDEVVLDDQGNRMFVCSDSNHCGERRAEGHVGPMADHALAGAMP